MAITAFHRLQESAASGKPASSSACSACGGDCGQGKAEDCLGPPGRWIWPLLRCPAAPGHSDGPDLEVAQI